ncbi:MAG: hypothetical protein PHD58_03805 [Anaerolineales bacterium]|nr:hypothetical protein [Anaerolineales bacterium]
MRTDVSKQIDLESAFVDRLSEAINQSGHSPERIAFINLYVALKSKPMAILIGPGQSGKIAAVQCLAHLLMGDHRHCQMMIGHPWRFEKSEMVAWFAEVHERFTTQKLLGLIEEAWHPDNARQVFIACLTRISPSELLNFFSEVAYQLRHNQLMRIGNVHFSEPIPFPTNLFLIGTMDTSDFGFWGPDLLSKTNLIRWNNNGVTTALLQSDHSKFPESEFLRSCIRDKQEAYRRVHMILEGKRQPLRPLLQVEALLSDYAIASLSWLVDEAMVFLANSWTRQGIGLFDPCPNYNLEIALDYAISQAILPLVYNDIHNNRGLKEALRITLDSRFPRSTSFLDQ